MKEDLPIFDEKTWNLNTKQIELTRLARKLGQEKFSTRAAHYDRTATFPTENYKDLFDSGLIGICIPEPSGGHGADFKTYMLTAAEIGRYCGATALTFNMHVSSCLWSGHLIDNLDIDDNDRTEHNVNREVHYRRILDDGAIYAQPFSEGGSAAAGATSFQTTALRAENGWIVNGKKIFASLS